MTVVQLKLILSGDVELNPGPPKRAPKAPEKAKEPPKEENNVAALETKVIHFWYFFFLKNRNTSKFANAGMYKAFDASKYVPFLSSEFFTYFKYKTQPNFRQKMMNW